VADSALAVRSRRRPRRPAPGASGQAPWRPVWSAPAAIRALRATVVVPGLFALTFKVIGDLQMALFAVFGGFATLVMASFGGTRRDKAIAHLGLAVIGSVALVIGTVVSGTAWLAAIVTVPVAFAIFFAGVAGPNAASGVTAALLAYVLPVASAGTAAEIPARLAGWWLASAVSTAAVLVLSPRSSGDRLRAAAAASATTLSRYLRAALRGEATPADREASIAAKHELMNLFVATPYRPTGLATADQALANVAQLLEWCTSLVSDALDGHPDLRPEAQVERELLGVAAGVLTDVASLLGGQDIATQDVLAEIARLEDARVASAAHQRNLSGDAASIRDGAVQAFHAQVIAIAARSVAADALIAARRADPETVAAQRRTWYGRQEDGPPTEGRLAPLAGAAGIAARHASLRSVWFLSSARGAVALAAAVLVADLSDVQHGFWVVLGTLSVLRTSAASTGATVMRALAGTGAGFVIGAALVLAIGTGTTALWVALPIAVLVASYAPGTAPFAVGQAAFTITVVVLFNLLVPAGWKVGLLRIQDVAIGCAVSLLVGALFWPRGAAGVVGDDLADAFRRGAVYLTQAVDWALGLRPRAPDTAVAAVSAGVRLDDALRGFLAEQGTKRVPKEDLWRLVMATMRLRLTANSLAGLGGPPAHDGTRAGTDGYADPVTAALTRGAADLADFYERVAVEVGPPRYDEPPRLDAPELPGMDGPAGADGPNGGVSLNAARAPFHPRTVWVREHLRHLGEHAQTITASAEHVAELRRVPWWR
jgi:uncharacterized membrane protein YccC